MDPALTTLGWIVAVGIAWGFPLLAVWLAGVRTSRWWAEREGVAMLPPLILHQYGVRVRMGLAGVDAVREDHRAGYRAHRRYLVAGAILPPLGLYAVVLLARLIGLLD
jgi:hypothetical protein